MNMYGIYCKALEREIERMVRGDVRVAWSETRDMCWIQITGVTCNHEIHTELEWRNLSDSIIEGQSAVYVAKQIVKRYRNRIIKDLFRK